MKVNKAHPLQTHTYVKKNFQMNTSHKFQNVNSIIHYIIYYVFSIYKQEDDNYIGGITMATVTLILVHLSMGCVPPILGF